MRSYFRSSMNSATICFAAPSLLGAKSVCPMLPDMSKRDGYVHPLAADHLPGIADLGPGSGDNQQRQRHRT